jgi:hypothetical protein
MQRFVEHVIGMVVRTTTKEAQYGGYARKQQEVGKRCACEPHQTA